MRRHREKEEKAEGGEMGLNVLGRGCLALVHISILQGCEGGKGEFGEGVSAEDISRAYCSLAEVYLTDSW